MIGQVVSLAILCHQTLIKWETYILIAQAVCHSKIKIIFQKSSNIWYKVEIESLAEKICSRISVIQLKGAGSFVQIIDTELLSILYDLGLLANSVIILKWQFEIIKIQLFKISLQLF